MRIGIAFDLQSDFVAGASVPEDAFDEYESPTLRPNDPSRNSGLTSPALRAPPSGGPLPA